MAIALLDTDMLSELLKQRHPQVTSRAAEYLRLYGKFAFSVFTRLKSPEDSRRKVRQISSRDSRSFVGIL